MANEVEDKKNIPALIQEILNENNVTEEDIARVEESFRAQPEKKLEVMKILFTELRKNTYDRFVAINSKYKINLLDEEVSVDIPNALLWVMDKAIAAIRNKDFHQVAATYFISNLLSEKINEMIAYRLSRMQLLGEYEDDE